MNRTDKEIVRSVAMGVLSVIGVVVAECDRRAERRDRIAMQRGLNAEADDANELREKRGTRRPSTCEPTAEDIAEALDKRIRYAMLGYAPLIRLRQVDQCLGEVTSSECAEYDVATPLGVIDVEDIRAAVRWGFGLDTMRAWIRAAQPDELEKFKKQHGENW